MKTSSIQLRYVIVIITTLCPLICYMGRQNLSLAIVAMIDNKEANATYLQLPGKPGDLSDACPAPVDHNGKSTLPKNYGPKYDWTPSEKSLLFEAFFITYVIFQIPVGRLAEVAGAKWILAIAAAGTAIINFFVPWAASIHPYALAALRALLGICQTGLYPAGYVLYSQWLTPAELSQAMPVLIAGAFLGAIIASSATGYFNEQPSLGWPYAFYMPGVACAVWTLIWIILGTSKPSQHRCISQDEVEYIESRNEARKSAILQKKEISWKKIATSRHILIMVIGCFASNWAFYVTLIQIPSYLNSILRVPDFKNGLINSVIYTLFIVCSPIIGCMSALMIEAGTFGLTRLQTRKLFQGIGLFSQAFCFLLLPLIGCDTTLVLVVLFSQVVLYSFINGGEVQLPQDLSRDFAGTIYAIGNGVGASAGFIVPRVHSLIVPDIKSRAAWNLYFYLSALIISIGSIIFVIFIKNDSQDFSQDDTSLRLKE